MRHRDAWRIADVTRFVINNFVARVRHGAKGDVHRFADADRNDDLVLRMIVDVKFLRDMAGDHFTQPQETKVGSVARFSTFQRVNGGFPDVPRRDEVRLRSEEHTSELQSLAYLVC